MNISNIPQIKHADSGNFFVLAGPCAIEGEEMALKIAERLVTITNELKIPYVFKGSFKKANRSRIDSFSGIGDEKALKILPDDATTLNNYAYYLSLRKNKLDKAEKMSKKSLQLQPDSKSFLDTYGWILYQQGKYTEAKDYIEKAIKAGGQEDGTLYEHLGDIYYKLNEVDKAKENWKKAKEKGEDSPLLNKKMNEGKLYEN